MERSTSRRILVATALILSSWIGPAIAYEGIEHRKISNLAVCLVEAIIGSRGPDESNRTEAAREALQFYAGSTIDRAKSRGHDQSSAATTASLAEDSVDFSYGHIVEYADYTSSPRNVLVHDAGKSGPQRVNVAGVMDAIDDWVTAAEEVSDNDHHFRLAALKEYHFQHSQAIMNASVGKIWDALALNAYADHFLQDSLAPGHMVADASDKSSPEVLRLHDRWNKEGMLFQIWPSAWSHITAPINELSQDKLDRCLQSIQPDRKNGAVTYQDWKALERTVIVDGGLILYGDNELLRKESIPRPRNLLFVTAVVVQSLLDVVEAYLSSTPRRYEAYFKDTSCVCADCETDAGECAPDRRCYAVSDGQGFYARNAIGWFPGTVHSISVCPPPPGSGNIDRLAARVSLTGMQGIAAARKAGSLAGKVIGTPFTRLPGGLPVLGFSADLQRLNEGSRKTISLEPIWTIPTGWTGWERFSLELSPGYTYVIGNDYEGHGPDGHVYFRWTNQDLFASLDVGYRFYGTDAKDKGVAVYGGRIGFQWTFLSIFAGVSADASVEGGSLDKDPTMFRLGAMLTMSPSQLGRLAH